MWTLLLLAATVRSFAHTPLGISDRNTTLTQKRAVFPAFSSLEVTLGQMCKIGIHFIINHMDMESVLMDCDVTTAASARNFICWELRPEHLPPHLINFLDWNRFMQFFKRRATAPWTRSAVCRSPARIIWLDRLHEAIPILPSLGATLTFRY